ncbi:MAG: hypothetical protein M3328_09850, partial [Chloroflexota bacterium]|nr:hypothetical protein [Chloroflexota bacterium]
DQYQGTRHARIVAYEFATGEITPVAELTHRDYAGNRLPGLKLGAWESSGIINASDLLGEDMWLLDVMPHGYKVPQFGDTDTAGQLLAMKVPGTATIQESTPGTPTTNLTPGRKRPSV